ncbi:hypothetical protein LguiA_024196 [Lonicera macranthoides]
MGEEGVSDSHLVTSEHKSDQGEETNNSNSEFLKLKLENVEREIVELKRRRSESAKANERVMGIFAAHEQGWFLERNKLRHQIGSLSNELKLVEVKRDEAVFKLKEQLHEKELLVKSKDKLLEEEENKMKELQEKLRKAETVANELREAAKLKAKEHSAELWKHKTTFFELVSTQRQLEAEMGRALRQVEAAKQELDSVLEQKEKSFLMTQKLSSEVVKIRKDLEQKDQILSAMLRKSKFDTTEKQMLLKEVKLSKTKTKQAELETERWRTVSESRHERHPLRSMLSKHTKSKPEDEQPKLRKDPTVFSPEQYMTVGSEEAEIKQLEGWVHSETEKYVAAVKQRHHLEIDAFAEQLRLKDEKLEAFRWRLMSMELESKRLHAHTEGLEHELLHLKQENLKLEALLLDHEAELHSLKMQLNPPVFHKANSNSPTHNPAMTQDTFWSKIKRKPRHEDQETTPVESSEEVETEKEETPTKKQPKEIIVLTVQPPEKEFEEGEVPLDQDSFQEECAITEEFEKAENLVLASQCSIRKNETLWKMDLHALGVSYKIKRIKQQLLMFERLKGKQEGRGDSESHDNGHFGIKGFNALMSMLNKQVNRYLTLQGKTDDLCKRMHKNDLDVNRGGSGVARSNEESKPLENFLEETFQLQRYIVAAGQKLVEVQSKIACGFIGAVVLLEGPASFDMKRFADGLRALFKEVQRGLEIRISRIIGDLESTLACEGMIHLQR